MERLTIDSDVERIEEARSWVAGEARAAGFGDDAVGELELALTEAVANVIEHAYDDAPGEPIELWAECDGATLRVRIRDWGRTPDPGAVRGRDLDEPGIGGYGVHLMDRLMDDVTREPQPEGGTLLTLIKTRKDVPHG